MKWDNFPPTDPESSKISRKAPIGSVGFMHRCHFLVDLSRVIHFYWEWEVMGFAGKKTIFQKEGCLPAFSLLLRQLKGSTVVWVLIKVFSIHLTQPCWLLSIGINMKKQVNFTAPALQLFTATYRILSSEPSCTFSAASCHIWSKKKEEEEKK